MRKFIITHPAYSGEATVTYNSAGLLCEINMQDTDMSMEERHYFKSKVASHIDNIAAKFDVSTVIVEAEYQVSLEDFNREYPYKRNTHLLPAIWAKMNKAQQLTALMAAKEYRKYCERNSGWYKPKIAASWLKNNEYLNDWKNL